MFACTHACMNTYIQLIHFCLETYNFRIKYFHNYQICIFPKFPFIGNMQVWKYRNSANAVITGGSRLSRIFWEHENLSGLSVIWLIQLLLLKTNIQIKHCSTSKGSYWEDVFVCIIFQSLSPKPDIRPFKVIYFVSVMTVIRFWFMGSYLMTLHFL